MNGIFTSIIVCVAMSTFAYGYGHRAGYVEGARDTQIKWDEQKNVDNANALALNAEYRAKEQAAVRGQQEAIRAAKLTEARRLDAVAHADAVDKRLRDYAAALAFRAGSPAPSAAPTGGSPPAAGPGDLLAELSGRLDTAARELADYADAAHTAGTACERSYNTLTGPEALKFSFELAHLGFQVEHPVGEAACEGFKRCTLPPREVAVSSE